MSNDLLIDRSQLWPVLMPWGLASVGTAVFAGIGRRLGLDRSSIGAPTLADPRRVHRQPQISFNRARTAQRVPPTTEIRTT